MSNIHGFGDFPASGGGGGGQQQYVGGLGQEDYLAVPLSAPPKEGVVHTLGERIMPRFNTRTFTFFISVVEVVMMGITFIVAAILPGGEPMSKYNTMAGPDSCTLFKMGSSYGPCIQAGNVWRLVTPMFLHAGLLHLFSNLLFQLHLGFTFELRWGTRRFLAIYLLTGLGASLLSVAVTYFNTSVGASGALFGLLGADFAYLFLNWPDVPQAQMELCFLVFIVVFNFLYAIPAGALGDDKTGTQQSGKNIDQMAHLGGLLMGMVGGLVLLPALRERPNTKMKRVVGGLLTSVFLFTTSVLIFTHEPAGHCPFC